VLQQIKNAVTPAKIIAVLGLVLYDYLRLHGPHASLIKCP